MYGFIIKTFSGIFANSRKAPKKSKEEILKYKCLKAIAENLNMQRDTSKRG